jgi:type IV pilus assembly protein PilM
LSEGMEMKVVVNDLRQAVTFADKLDQRELKKYLGALTVAIGAALYGGEADD